MDHKEHNHTDKSSVDTSKPHNNRCAKCSNSEDRLACWFDQDY